MRRRNLLKVIAVICVGSAAAVLTGCAHGYRLEGNHTWSTPAPQPKGQAYISAQNAGSGGSAPAGNTSFTR